MATIPLYPKSRFFAAKAGAYRQGGGLFGMSSQMIVAPGTVPQGGAEVVRLTTPAPTVPLTTVSIAGEYGNLLDGLPQSTRALVEIWVNQYAPTVLSRIQSIKSGMLNPFPKQVEAVETIRSGVPLIANAYSGYQAEYQKMMKELQKNPLGSVKSALYSFANRIASTAPAQRPAPMNSTERNQLEQILTGFIPVPPWYSGESDGGFLKPRSTIMAFNDAWKDAWFWWGIPQGKLDWNKMYSSTLGRGRQTVGITTTYNYIRAGGLGIPFMWPESGDDWVQAGNLRIKFTERGGGGINGRFFPFFPWPTRIKSGYNVTTTSAPNLEDIVKWLNMYNTNKYYNKAQREKLPAAFEVENGIPTVDIFGPLQHVKQSAISKYLKNIPGWAKIAVALIPGIGPVVTAASFAVSVIEVKQGREMQKQIKSVMEGTELLFEKTEGKVPAEYRLSYEQWLESNKEGIEEVGLNIDLLKAMSINEGLDIMEEAQEKYEIKVKSMEQANVEAGTKPPSERTQSEQDIVDASKQIDPNAPVDPAQPITDIVLTLLTEDEAATGDINPPKLTMQNGSGNNTILYIGGGLLLLYALMKMKG